MTLLTSWVESANSADTDFPLNNLPYGVFSTDTLEPRCGVAIGDRVLGMAAVEAEDLILLHFDPVFDVPYWNDVMDLGPDAWATLRDRLTDLLATDSPDQAKVAPHLVPMADIRLHMPIGYNGRASTVVVSGTDIRRPNGQIKPADAETPHFGPSQRLDIELEMGAIVGTSTDMGDTPSVAEADEMIFGYVLLNDWSARDIQAWEYQPLGPFQAKAFATSISPWIVTKAALEPFRASTPEREVDLLPYLAEPKPMLYDIDLSVIIQPDGGEQQVIARTNYNTMYYSAPQQLAHHAASGCAMNAGDLLGSGTISGPDKDARGSLLELSWGGAEPIALNDGTTRSFVQDGDTMILTGHAAGDGYRIGFGACAGTILPANPTP